MKTSADRSSFVRAFEQAGRSGQFSRAALFAIFEYLEEMETDTGSEIELDVVAICCDYSEYKSAFEAYKEYTSGPEDKELDEGAREAMALEYLRDKTQVIEFAGGVIVAAF